MNWYLPLEWCIEKCKHRSHCLHDHIWTQCSCKVYKSLLFYFLVFSMPSPSNIITKDTTILNSTRVSNELGAGNPDRARQAMFVTLLLSFLLGLSVVLLLAFGHNIWAGFFSSSPVIIQAFASMTPLLTISVLADSVQGVLSGSHEHSPSRSSFTNLVFRLTCRDLQGWLEDVVGNTWLWL